MDRLQNGWFSEINNLWPGQAMSIQVEEVLVEEKSKFQDVLVFKSKTYGNVLVLDGVIQCTERDEFSYQEMLAHIPLNSHPNPKKVLIIGGGDGGILREVLKHSCVEQVEQCEIDEKVIEVSKKYLPQMAESFNNPKLKLHVGDGFEYMKQHQGQYDVIITDSSDPVGPASSLFEKSYYELMKTALKPDGILSCQGECMWLHLDLIKGMMKFCKSLYPVIDYAYTTIPTYPSGQIGFVLCSKNPVLERIMETILLSTYSIGIHEEIPTYPNGEIGLVLCSKNPDTVFKEPVRTWTSQEISDLKLKYYNTEVHKAAFVLPEFARKIIREHTENGDTKDTNGTN